MRYRKYSIDSGFAVLSPRREVLVQVIACYVRSDGDLRIQSSS